MARLAAARQSVPVVTDQRGQPTWTQDVARQVIALAERAVAGIYHATSSGETSWHGLAMEVFRLAGADPGLVRPITSEGLSRPARRPGYSVLGHGRLADGPDGLIGDWRLALRRAWPSLRGGTAR